MFDFADFLTFEYITSFAGMLVVIVLMTQFTKNVVDAWLGKIATQWVVLFWSFILNVIAIYGSGGFTAPIQFEIMVVGFFNIFVIWWASMKAYETFVAAFMNTSEKSEE